ncbi:hypothetical protein TI03_04505 [Achromatium sp. WMS1]|nr:hypothetical protein TI03_04505 [Achromatium sp. WMS1]
MTGIGTEKNIHLAKLWLNRAALQGHNEAYELAANLEANEMMTWMKFGYLDDDYKYFPITDYPAKNKAINDVIVLEQAALKSVQKGKVDDAIPTGKLIFHE